MESSAPGKLAPAYEGWAVLELQQHRPRYGYVREVEMYGGKLLRIDIPIKGGEVTEFYACTAICALYPRTSAPPPIVSAWHGLSRQSWPK